MRIAIHCITLAIGAILVWQGVLGHMGPIAVWSDFKAFSARIAQDESARHVLTYGGENEGTDFDYLLNRVWSLSDDWTPVILSGILLCGLGAAGIVVEIVQKRKKGSIEQQAP